jgi:23S rRNA (pseudouridine1915-N3)-methyltransferase
VLLDERGDELDSIGMAQFIEKHRNLGTKRLAFVIGGPDGVSEDVRKRANLILALSRMTLTHEIARMVLFEQIYRAFTVIHDLPYQK